MRISRTKRSGAPSLRHCERQFAAPRRISEALVSPLGVDEVLRQTLAVAIEVLDADAGSLQMHDAESDSLTFRYVADPSHDALIGHATPVSQGIGGRVFRSGVSDLAEDVTLEARTSIPPLTTKTGYCTRSVMTVAQNALPGRRWA